MECITAILNRDEDAIARLAPLRRYGKAVQGADLASEDGGAFPLPRAA